MFVELNYLVISNIPITNYSSKEHKGRNIHKHEKIMFVKLDYLVISNKPIIIVLKYFEINLTNMRKSCLMRKIKQTDHLTII